MKIETWYLKDECTDYSLIYFDINTRYVAFGLFGHMIGIDF